MTIENLIAKAWALESRFHNVQAALLLKKLQGGQQTTLDYSAEREMQVPYFSAHNPSAGHRGNNGDYLSWDIQPAKSGHVAIIPIIGTMTRYGGLCSYGTESIANWVLEANVADYVSSIVLEINSPGGEVDGTELLGAIVKQSQKPVVAYVAGMAASAAYWVASQAKEIVMESETSSEVGSIGVLSMHIDASAAYEKDGYKVKIVRSEGSEDKALYNSVEPLTPELEATLKAELNVIRKQFIKTVKAGRPGIADDVFTGKMFNGKDAIARKMADRIGFLGDAVYRADLHARKAA
jgi:protease-4